MEKLIVIILVFGFAGIASAGNYNVITTTEQDNILTIMESRTSKTTTELIQGAFDRWYKMIKPRMEAEQNVDVFKSLTPIQRSRAIELRSKYSALDADKKAAIMDILNSTE